MTKTYNALRDTFGLTRVHITDADGNVQYNRLLDSGRNVLRFVSGFGFVCRDEMRAKGFKVIDGWDGYEEISDHQLPPVVRPATQAPGHTIPSARFDNGFMIHQS